MEASGRLIGKVHKYKNQVTVPLVFCHWTEVERNSDSYFKTENPVEQALLVTTSMF